MTSGLFETNYLPDNGFGRWKEIQATHKIRDPKLISFSSNVGSAFKLQHKFKKKNIKGGIFVSDQRK